MDVAERYISLLKGCVSRTIFLDEEMLELQLTGWRARVWEAYNRSGNLHLMYPIAAHPTALQARREGREWPRTAETMIGGARLDNIQDCVESVIRDGVPGDLIETGVWRGGAAILMRGVLAAHGVTDRTVWLADSFEGLPAPDVEKYPLDAGLDVSGNEKLAVTAEQVRANFAKYDLLDDRVRFLEGWFKDTLPSAPLERLAVIRMDGDLYESTIDAISALYPKLSPGGYVIVDDYNNVKWGKACGPAIREYREQHRITEPIQEIDHTAIFWRRER